MPNSELSKYVYAILDQGQVIIATLDAEEYQHRMDHRPTVTQLETSHRYPAAMVFSATPANYDALQILYEDIKVPPIPMEPNDVLAELLKRQKLVFTRSSPDSYEHARRSPRVRVCGGVFNKDVYHVPYDVYGNEITSLDYVKGDTDAK